jgi:hypothetical protein
LSREPFRQFVIVTTSGEEYVVNSPKRVTIPMHGESVHYNTGRDFTTQIIAVRHIIKLIV